jgi:hypothetical protein
MDRAVAGAVPHVRRAAKGIFGSDFFLMRDDTGDRRKIRTTTLLLAAVALLFYLGFILLGAVQA